MARLTVEPAADYVGVSRSMLDKLRTAGGGPRFVKLGKKVLYDTLDLDRLVRGQQTGNQRPRRRRAGLGSATTLPGDGLTTPAICTASPSSARRFSAA